MRADNLALVERLKFVQAKEREARRKQLPVQDKGMYAVGSLISGNSAARTAIFFYALALHAAIFLILARASHRQVERLDDLEETCLRLQLSHAAAALSSGAAAAVAADGGGAGSSKSTNHGAGGEAVSALVAAAAGAAGEAAAQAGAALLRLLRPS